ncbi:MAG: helix-turn-helix domain-containing protein [Solimonas sp.]
MTTEHWSGTLLLARDFALLHGSAGVTQAHAHYAHQLLLSPDAPVELLLDGKRVVARHILIESMREHAIVAAPPSLYTLYAEPLTIDASTLGSIGADWPSVEALVDALKRLPRRVMGDARIAAALAEVDALLDGKVRAADIAARAQLSLSQLERLFAAHVGVPVRRLVRWRRLRLALALALAGETLTHAAHEAGFADSAHFSHAMREMFGVRADRALPGLSLRLID